MHKIKINRLRMIEKRVLWRIFGLKRDEIIGWWRKLHYNDLYNLYSSSNVIRMIKVKEDEMGRACMHAGF
jgi:hypothetical protein